LFDNHDRRLYISPMHVELPSASSRKKA